MLNSGVEVASAYVTLMPSMRGFRGKLDKQMKGIAKGAGSSAGETFGSGFAATAGKWAKRGAIAIGGAVTTALGASLWKGWNRLTAIENAESKLAGLGHSAKSVESIMESALKSVKGTAYGLGDAATIAAGAVAAGIEPGKQLTKYLKTTADAATIAGVSINEMGPIFNRVQTQQRAYTMELNMLADRGIPIYQWLQEELGVTQEQLRSMVQAGELDSETYFKAIEKNIGGAALESGNTTTGMIANIGAAMGRFGATLLSTVFPMLKPFFANVIEWIDNLTAKVEPMAEAFGVWFQETLVPGAEKAKESLMPVLEDMADWIEDNKEEIISIAAGVGTFLAGLLALKAGAKAMMLVRGAVMALRAAFTLLMAHPILLLVSALAAGFVYLWQTNEDFRKGVMDAWDKISAAVMTAWNEHIWPALKDFKGWIIDEVVPALKSFWEDTVKPTFKAIGDWITDVWDNLIYPVFLELKEFVLESLIPAILYFWNDIIKPTFKMIGETITKWWNEIIGPILGRFFRFISEDLGPIVLWLWNNVVEPAFKGIGKFIKEAWENVIHPAVKKFNDFLNDILIPALQWLWDVAVDVFEGTRDTIKNVWENGIKPSFNFLKDAVEAVGDTFEAVVDGIGIAWELLRMIVAKPIVAVLEFVNDGIIDGINRVLGWVSEDLTIPHVPISQGLKNAASGWYLQDRKGGGSGGSVVARASGGILPGFSPGRDDLFFSGPAGNLALSGGEAIMRPEWTRAIGANAIDRMNAAARTGGVAGVRSLLGDHDDRKGGGFGDWIGGLAADAWNFFRAMWSDPIGALVDMFMGPFNLLNSNPFYDFMVDGTKKIAGLAKDKILGMIGFGKDDDPGTGGRNGPGLPWQALWGMIKALVPSAIMTSNYRPGAITRSGYPSLHGMGRAVDFVAPNMRAAFNAIRPLLPWTELYYSPMEWQQMRGGRNYNTRGTPAYADHFDHIHAAFAKGGIFTGLYDDGGYLPPGLSLVANKTGKPEAVLTDKQWDALSSGGGGDTYNLFGVPMEVAGDVAATINYETRRNRRGKYARR